MAATPAWLAPVEALLNRGIQSSAQATVLARRLGGTALRLDIEGMASIRLSVNHARLSLGSAKAAPGSDSGERVDATLSGSPPALLRLAGATGLAGEARGAAVSGNAEIANAYRELLAAARPDFEEELSRLIGDIPARGISQLISNTLVWVRSARRTARENIAEYLEEESRDLVNRIELGEFLEGVDALRERADRVEARITRLERQLKGSV